MQGVSCVLYKPRARPQLFFKFSKQASDLIYLTFKCKLSRNSIKNADRLVNMEGLQQDGRRIGSCASHKQVHTRTSLTE